MGSNTKIPWEGQSRADFNRCLKCYWHQDYGPIHICCGYILAEHNGRRGCPAGVNCTKFRPLRGEDRKRKEGTVYAEKPSDFPHPDSPHPSASGRHLPPKGKVSPSSAPSGHLPPEGKVLEKKKPKRKSRYVKKGTKQGPHLEYRPYGKICHTELRKIAGGRENLTAALGVCLDAPTKWALRGKIPKTAADKIKEIYGVTVYGDGDDDLSV